VQKKEKKIEIDKNKKEKRINKKLKMKEKIIKNKLNLLKKERLKVEPIRQHNKRKIKRKKIINTIKKRKIKCKKNKSWK